MTANTYEFIYIYIHIYTYVCIYEYIFIYIYIYIYIFIYTCVCVCLSISVFLRAELLQALEDRNTIQRGSSDNFSFGQTIQSKAKPSHLCLWHLKAFHNSMPQNAHVAIRSKLGSKFITRL